MLDETHADSAYELSCTELPFLAAWLQTSSLNEKKDEQT